MIVPAAAVPGVLADAEDVGVKSATVYASMIGDGDDPESKKRGAWLADFVANSRLRVAGPNCMGAYSFRERLFGYPNADLCRLEPGSVACIFQSGGLLQFWMRAAADRGLAIFLLHHLGQRARSRACGLPRLRHRRSRNPAGRAVHRRHPAAPRVHECGRARARHGQADPRHQDRRHREIASRVAIAYRRHRRRLRRLPRHVRALWHRQLPLAR